MQGGHKNVFQMCNCRQDINPLKTTQHDWQGLKGQLCCNTLYTSSDVFNTRKFAFFCDEKVSFRRRDNSDVVSCWQWIRQHERYVLTSGASRPIDSRNNINSHQKYGLAPHMDMAYSEALRYWKCTCHHNHIHYKVSVLLVYFYADVLESYTFGFLSKQFLNGICLTWQISAWITHKRRHLCGAHLFKAVLQ